MDYENQDTNIMDLFRDKISPHKAPESRLNQKRTVLHTPRAPFPPHLNVINVKFEDLRITYNKEKTAWLKFYKDVQAWKREADKLFNTLRLELITSRQYKSEVEFLKKQLQTKNKEISQLKK